MIWSRRSSPIASGSWSSSSSSYLIASSTPSTGGIEIYFKDQTLYIKDSGIGIKNSDVLRVFERGFSGYNGHLTQQSSGLGLYLSKKIAEQLGHRITLHSEVGQGTTVAIRFEEKKLVMD